MRKVKAVGEDKRYRCQTDGLDNRRSGRLGEVWGRAVLSEYALSRVDSRQKRDV